MMEIDRFDSGNTFLAPAILTRKIYPSPLIKTILIGSHGCVIFVGHDTINVKKFDQRGFLQGVGSHTVFGSKIRAAQILRKLDDALAESSQDGSVGAESKDDLMHVDEPVLCKVLLTLESRELLILQFDELSPGPIAFQCQVNPLPAHKTSIFEEPGRFIAIDPLCRAAAIAAVRGTIVVYNCAKTENVNTDLSIGTVIHNKFGNILKLDFVHSLGNSNNEVCLVAINIRNKRLYASVYSWVVTTADNTCKIDSKTFPLGREHGHPTCFIPLRFRGAFMLICQRAIAIYNNAHVETFLSQVAFKKLKSSKSRGTSSTDNPSPYRSKKHPIFCTWSRPVANTLSKPNDESSYWSNREDLIYLGREDGEIHCIQVRKTASNRLEISKHEVVGNVQSGIDTAFAVSTDPRNDHVIITGGAPGNGGLYKIGYKDNYQMLQDQLGNGLAYDRITLKQHFPNWAPFTDLTVWPMDRNSSAPSPDYDRLFTTSGRQPSGAITELKYGFETSIEFSVDLEDLTGANNVWMVTNTQEKYFFLSFPSCTLLYRLRNNDFEVYDFVDEASLAISKLVLSDSNQTSITREVVIHITRSKVQVLRFVQNHHTPYAVERSWDFNQITSATIDSESARILLCCRQYEENGLLHYMEVLISGTTYELRTISSVEGIYGVPTASNINSRRLKTLAFSQTLSGRRTSRNLTKFAVIGTSNRHLYIFEIDEMGQLKELFCEPAHLSYDGLRTACDSIAIISPSETDPSETQVSLLLLTGWRNGILHNAELRVKENETGLELVLSKTQQLSATTVRIMPDPSNLSAAFIHYGSNLCHLDFTNRSVEEGKLSMVIFPEHLGVSAKTFPIDAIFASNGETLITGNRKTVLVTAISGSTLLQGHIEMVERAAPQSISVPGTPTRLLYSRQLDVIFFATTVTKVDPRLKKRFLIPSIYSVRADNTDDADTAMSGFENFIVDAHVECVPGDKIQNLREWILSKDHETHYFLVAAVITLKKNAKPGGSLKFFKASKRRDGTIHLSKDKDSNETSPVYDVCPFGESSLVYSCGTELRLRTYSSAEKKFKKRVIHRFMSPATRISVHGRDIVATTTEHSLIVLHVENDQVVKEFYDDRSRTGIFHMVNVLRYSMEIFFTEEGRISAFQCPSMDTGSPALDMYRWAELELPSTVNRLCRAATQNYWNLSRYVLLKEISRINRTFGTATDGSLYCFHQLRKLPGSVLKYLQDQLLSNPDISRLLHPANRKSISDNQGNTLSGAAHISGDLLLNGGTTSDAAHIDGDLLASLIDRSDAVDILRRVDWVGFKAERSSGKPTSFRDCLIRVTQRTLTKPERPDESDIDKELRTRWEACTTEELTVRFIRALLRQVESI